MNSLPCLAGEVLLDSGMFKTGNTFEHWLANNEILEDLRGN